MTRSEDESGISESRDDSEVANLLQIAGRRRQPPAALRSEARQRTAQAWRQKVAQRKAQHHKTQHRRLVWGLAASALLAVALWWAGQQPEQGQPDVMLATVEAVFGENQQLSVGDTVSLAGEIDSGESRLAVRLLGGAALRVDQHSRVRFDSASELTLLVGGIYIDTGSASSADGLAVQTAHGTAFDIGTQFEVRTSASETRVRVREGEVRFDSENETDRAVAGVELAIAEGTVVSRPIEVFGADWSWTLASAPSFELEGRTLRSFLDWVCRETGWHLRFADPQLEELAGTIVTHGSLHGLPPDEAPELVLPTSGLTYEVVAGELWIRQP